MGDRAYTSKVDYIREHAEDDILNNKRLSGKDCSHIIGGFLMAFLIADPRRLEHAAIYGTCRMEEEIEEQTGLTLSFAQTEKCGYMIKEICLDRDDASLHRVKEYAVGLLVRPLKDEERE